MHVVQHGLSSSSAENPPRRYGRGSAYIRGRTLSLMLITSNTSVCVGRLRVKRARTGGGWRSRGAGVGQGCVSQGQHCGSDPRIASQSARAGVPR
jgi:hypothetical protein